MKRTWLIAIALLLALPAAADDTTAGGKCLTCHKEKTPGLYQQWYRSAHAANGVGCLECHGAQASDPDAFKHEGALIATLVTPKDCGQCHSDEVAQVDQSYHATAGLILESQDSYLAQAVAGDPAAVAGCESCHGTKVKIDPRSPNKLARLSWPNSGIGRLNPDGSKGSCTACHSRHHFSAAQARQPEACGKCHLGPDHPQREVYEESKHGISYATLEHEMNLQSKRWVVGVDYDAAPTCATCHMSATTAQKVNHDVGQRISWSLRPPVSKHKDDWQQKRKNMQNVCAACHSAPFYLGHYAQFDGAVRLYDVKFGKPATALMELIRKRGLLKNQAEFGNKLEWIYWELWHHEGRRGRHGAAMMGPDYTWWNGLYETAKHFYFELIPAARELNDPEVNGYLDQLLANDKMHSWINRPTEQIKQEIRAGKLQELYRDLYQPE